MHGIYLATDTQFYGAIIVAIILVSIIIISTFLSKSGDDIPDVEPIGKCKWVSDDEKHCLIPGEDNKPCSGYNCSRFQPTE